MNTKRLITASIFSLISASTALAADVLIPHQSASSTSSTIVAPTFSWTGLYLGVQAGGFSSKADMALVGRDKSLLLDKEFSPKLSGFVGGFYAGSNIDLGDNFVFGIDTDLILSGKKHTKTISIGAVDSATVENAVVRSRRSAEVTSSVSTPASAVQTSSGKAQVSEEKSTSPDVQTLPTSTIETASAGSKTVEKKQSTEVRGTDSATRPTATTQLKRGAQKKGEGVQVRSKPASSTTKTSSEQTTSSSLGRSDTGQLLVSKVSETSPVTSEPASSSARENGSKQPLSLARLATGEQSSGAEVSEQKTPVKTVEKASGSSAISSTGSESSQPAAKLPTSVQSSGAEKTVPSSPLTLARSGASGSDQKTSNGTNAGHHSIQGDSGNNAHVRVSSNGTGHNVNPHAVSSGSGHGSGAHPHGSRPHGGQNVAGQGAQNTQAVAKSDSSVYGLEQIKKVASELGFNQEDEVETLNHTFKQKWGGATRIRIGFTADRFMPYLAGGIAYGQFQDIVSLSVKNEDGKIVSSKNLTDETKAMIGYTLGGGIDFAMLDNVIVRAEYRYSDFGKKKFAKEKFEINYKTNDFRVGVAYKF
ncbi:opacity protein-like surface antigen [Bartonella fuyuanensis]|uniref:Porin n=1 Tax=Bartonella fuyuanensis TaxID=1460968 RepID=A0A840DTW0_9HYPH|nr:porin [Bartonella fuyuanensis]MBB4076544.1 opacity protein-like surface antigen [Bartonella fuyuanensis]